MKKPANYLHRLESELRKHMRDNPDTTFDEELADYVAYNSEKSLLLSNNQVTAIEQSIEFWEGAQGVDYIDTRGDNSLCDLALETYYGDTDTGTVRKGPCSVCPVCKYTGKEDCAGTPLRAIISGQTEEPQAMVDWLTGLLEGNDPKIYPE